MRGFHEYRSVWTPTIDEELVATNKADNIHDRYAIAAFKLLLGTLRPSIVGHLPREISGYYVIIHGGRVSCQVVDAHHRRSPLVQGGLEFQFE